MIAKSIRESGILDLTSTIGQWGDRARVITPLRLGVGRSSEPARAMGPLSIVPAAHDVVSVDRFYAPMMVATRVGTLRICDVWILVESDLVNDLRIVLRVIVSLPRS